MRTSLQGKSRMNRRCPARHSQSGLVIRPPSSNLPLRRIVLCLWQRASPIYAVSGKSDTHRYIDDNGSSDGEPLIDTSQRATTSTAAQTGGLFPSFLSRCCPGVDWSLAVYSTGDKAVTPLVVVIAEYSFTRLRKRRQLYDWNRAHHFSALPLYIHRLSIATKGTKIHTHCVMHMREYCQRQSSVNACLFAFQS